MKKVLFVVDERMTGGVNLLLEDILKKITDQKIDLMILHNHGTCFESIQNVNILYGDSWFETIDISLKKLMKEKKWKQTLKKIYVSFLMKTKLIIPILKKKRKKMNLPKYDVEICFKSGFCSIFTAVSNSEIKISWVHEDYQNNDPTKKYHSLFKQIFEQMEVIIGVSDKVVESLRTIYPDIKKTMIIENYIDDQKVKNGVEILDKPAPLEFVTVGRLHPVKGYERLLQAISQLNQEQLWNNVHFTFVGDGEEREKLESLVKQYELEKSVSFVGMQKNPFPYIARSDLFILSSYSEGYGNVLIESMILKVPVLSTNVTSISKIITKKNYGFCVENSLEGIYEGLKKILKDPECLLQKKKNLEQFHYDGEKIIKKIRNVMEGIF